MNTPLPPDHVLDGFGVVGDPVACGPAWDNGWRYGETVLSPVADHPRAAWSGKVRENLDLDGVTVVRSLRSSDGRHVITGWQARAFVPGAPAPRVDETVSATLRLAEALEPLARPRFLVHDPHIPFDEVDVFTAADAAAWADEPATVLEPGLDGTAVPREDVADALRLAAELAEARRPIDLPSQVVHTDMLATTLYAGTAAPAVTDITASWRPAQWAAAVVVVDGLAWGNADDAVIDRWAHLPEWPQLLLRALLFRLFVHCLHPMSQPGAWRGLARVGELVRIRV